MTNDIPGKTFGKAGRRIWLQIVRENAKQHLLKREKAYEGNKNSRGRRPGMWA